MKNLPLLLLALFFGQIQHLIAQNEPDNKCYDKLILRSGSQFVGELKEILPGDSILFRTWNGVDLRISNKVVRKTVQHCTGMAKKTRTDRVYSFREHGLYNHTRISALLGQNWSGDAALGFSMQHSFGWQFNRLLGAGLGLGVEIYEPFNADIPTYPVFAEMRGYLFAKPVTPFYTLGAGWGIAGRSAPFITDTNENWKGGWMAQAEFGYRINNHFTIQVGLHFQHKTRDWSSNWSVFEHGTDQILHKRLEIGFGLIL